MNSVSLAIMEVQLKTIIGHHFTATTVTIIKKTDDSIGEDGETLEHRWITGRK